MKSVKLGDLSTPIALKNTLNTLVKNLDNVEQNIAKNKAQIDVQEQNIAKNTEDIILIKNTLLQDNVVAKVINVDAYTERVTAEGTSVVNGSYAKVLRIEGKTVKNLCPNILGNVLDNGALNANVKVTTSSGYSDTGNYLVGEYTEYGLDIRLMDGVYPVGDTIVSVEAVGGFTIESSLTNITLDASKTYHLSCNYETSLPFVGTFELSSYNMSTDEYTYYYSGDTITGVSELPMTVVRWTVPNGTSLPVYEDGYFGLTLTPMLVEGTKPLKDYLPIGNFRNSKIKSIKSEGSNLLNIDEGLNENLVYEGNGVYCLTKNGAYEGRRSGLISFDKPLPVGVYTISVDFIDTTVTHNQKLILSGTGGAGSVTTTYSYGKFTVTAEMSALSIYIQAEEANGVYVRFKNLTLTRGYDGEKQPYSPYGVNDTLVISEQGVELSKWDYIDSGANIAIQTHSESIFDRAIYSGTTNIYYVKLTKNCFGANFGEGNCNNFTIVQKPMAQLVEGEAVISTSTKNLYFYSNLTLAQLNAQLAVNPIKISYKIATPIYEPLSIDMQYLVWTNGTETVDTADEIAPTIVTDYLTII